MRLGSIIFHNFLAKILSLILAIATWFYVFDLANVDSGAKRKETVQEIFSRYRFITKEVPVKPVFYGDPPNGYRIAMDKVIVDPARITVFGPEDILNNVEELDTDKINVGEYTRSVKLQLGIDSNEELLNLKDRVVDVYLPVESTSKGQKDR